MKKLQNIKNKIDWNNVLYVGIVLDEVSQEILKHYLDIMLEGKTPNKIFCHHMTVLFGNNPSEEMKTYIQDNIGKEFVLHPIAYGESDKAVAVEVETDAITTNKIEHITLCTLNDGKPVDSNFITEWRKIDNKQVALKGTLTCITKQKRNC